MSLQYKIVPVTAFEQNCSILWCDETNDAAVVDPGGDIPKILAFVQSKGLKLCKIIFRSFTRNLIALMTKFPDEKIVAVVGAGHVEGMTQLIKQNLYKQKKA